MQAAGSGPRPLIPSRVLSSPSLDGGCSLVPIYRGCAAAGRPRNAASQTPPPCHLSLSIFLLLSHVSLYQVPRAATTYIAWYCTWGGHIGGESAVTTSVPPSPSVYLHNPRGIASFSTRPPSHHVPPGQDPSKENPKKSARPGRFPPSRPTWNWEMGDPAACTTTSCRPVQLFSRPWARRPGLGAQLGASPSFHTTTKARPGKLWDGITQQTHTHTHAHAHIQKIETAKHGTCDSGTRPGPPSSHQASGAKGTHPSMPCRGPEKPRPRPGGGRGGGEIALALSLAVHHDA